MDKVPQFKTWKDKGGNIGIECLECHRTHWSANDPDTNPLTGNVCDNCVEIRKIGLLARENERHGQHNDEQCDHTPSQPTQ